ncbi:hypothetical protein GCM10011611_34690 [Aliidongia dinghuensis]|uniref:Uncharacterized protein n=1 Tax=Aliidongia dinghuensis TaxID=1867774 RepID=A0A8J2YVY7_9PROT|nr:hypothetical protein [Aliidongia dinghuensis]GGF25670.1 hypothetical protein GCM10011611_34690 [Aliidongia dinghuensis]
MSRQGTAARIGLFIWLLAAVWPLTGRATENLLDSQAPYWEAGPRDPKLSNACSLGRFNERQMGRYIVRLHAKAGGAAVLGVAKGTGLNLWDPDRLAVKTEDYLFRQDGTSACEVFVGGRQPLLPGQTPPGQSSPRQPGTPAGPQAPGSPAAPSPQQAVPGASPQNGPPT